MKNLKKILSLVLCLMMALVLLAGCGGKKEEKATAPKAEVTATPEVVEPTPAVATELTPADLILGVWELSEIIGDDEAAADLAKIKARGAAVTCTLTKTDMTWDASYANEKHNNSVPYVVEDGKIIYGDKFVTYVLEGQKLTMTDPANEAVIMVLTLKKSLVPATATPQPEVTATPAPTPVVVVLTPEEMILGVWELSEINGDDEAAADLAEIKARGAAVTCTFTKTDMTWDASYANEKHNGSVPYVVEDGKIIYGDKHITYVIEEKKLTMTDPANEAVTMVFVLKKSLAPVATAPAAMETPAN